MNNNAAKFGSTLMPSSYKTIGEARRLVSRFKDLHSRENLAQVTLRGLDKVSVYLQTPLRRQYFKHRHFDFEGKTYHYEIDSYNATWRNERSVEIALMKEFLQRHANRSILEVGNVARYYGSYNHPVLDKYEIHPDVINEDFLTFEVGNKPFDGLLSISTFEHIGWDESPKEPAKVEGALAKIARLVKDPQCVLITFPLGYNDHLDQMVKSERLPFARDCFLRRTSKQGIWEQARKDQCFRLRYHEKYPGANELFVGLGLKST